MSEYHASVNTGANSQEELAVAANIDLPTQLRWLLRGYLGEELNLRNLAELLYVSERSLQRRLTESGTSFRQLQEETRFHLARQLLHETQISVTEIGFELGYSNPANFTRAFHR